MIILIISFIILIVGIAISMLTDWETLGYGLSFSFGTILVILLIIWPVNYYGGIDGAQQYTAIKQTIEQSRMQQISDIERAALTTKIIEVNQNLASAKYWNTTTFDCFIYDGYANLEYLK